MTQVVWREPGWAEMLETCIEGAMYSPDEASKEAQSAEKASERMNFMRVFWVQAMERAKAAGVEPQSDQAWAILEEASEIGEGIALAYLWIGDLGKARKAPTVAATRAVHSMHIPKGPGKLQYLSGIDVHFPPHEELEHAVQAYLESSWRTDEIDRIVLRLLLELEVGQYIHQMAEPNLLNDGPSKLSNAQTVSRRTGFGQSLKIIGFTVLALILVALLAVVFPRAAQWIIPFGAGASLVIGTLWLGIVLWAFTSSRGKAIKKKSHELVDLVSLGLSALNRYQGDGPIAVSELRRDVEELRDAGYVLPQTLFATLDLLDREEKTLL